MFNTYEMIKELLKEAHEDNKMIYNGFVEIIQEEWAKGAKTFFWNLFCYLFCWGTFIFLMWVFIVTFCCVD